MNSKLLTPQATHANNVYGEVYENGKREESEEMDQTAVLIEPEKCHRIDKISENNKRKSEIIKQSIKRQALKKPVLSTLDILISIFVVTPLVVTCWRGTWILMDLNFYYFPVWESFTIGIAAHVALAIGQNVFHDIVIKTEINKWYLRALFFILMKIYTYVFLIITNLHWRGGWAIMDKYCGLEIKNRQLLHYEASLGLGAVCLVLIFLMKCLKNATSPPFAICMDKGDDMFLFPTMFRQKIGEKTSLYVLDCVFSVLVVGTLVVFVWRGAWVFIDLTLFPEDQIWSAWSSLILGYSLVAVAFLLQPLMRYFCEVLSGAPRLLVADFFILFSFIGTVNVWRGIWYLLDLYVLPNDIELSCWICHSVALILLILLGCSNSLLVRGVYIDAEEPAGKCVVFPCHYLRIIFQKEKLKQTNNKGEQDNEKGENVEKNVENNHIVTLSFVESRKG